MESLKGLLDSANEEIEKNKGMAMTLSQELEAVLVEKDVFEAAPMLGEVFLAVLAQVPESPWKESFISVFETNFGALKKEKTKGADISERKI